MSDHTDTTLTDTERRYAYEHFGDDDEHFGRCYLEADVESIVAARVAAARADERARLVDRLRDIIATPDDEQWWPVEPYTDPVDDDEVVEVQVINADRLRALIEGADK